MSRQASGLRAWVLQRVTAIYLLLFFPYLVGRLAFFPPAEHAEWAAWVSHPVVSIGLLMFFFSLLAHAWVGIRDVILDYIHPNGIRLPLLGLFAVGLVGCGVWALKLVLMAQHIQI